MTDLPKLEWINERPEGTDEIVVGDIAKSLASLKTPENLGYHTVFLGDDMEASPGVIVTGEAGNPNFVCEYFPRIGEAFETLRPNLDPEQESMLKELGLDRLTGEDLESVIAALKEKGGAVDPEAAVRVFIRDRGGKAPPSDDDHPLGHNAIENRRAENEQQDKGA